MPPPTRRRSARPRRPGARRASARPRRSPAGCARPPATTRCSAPAARARAAQPRSTPPRPRPFSPSAVRQQAALLPATGSPRPRARRRSASTRLRTTPPGPEPPTTGPGRRKGTAASRTSSPPRSCARSPAWRPSTTTASLGPRSSPGGCPPESRSDHDRSAGRAGRDETEYDRFWHTTGAVAKLAVTCSGIWRGSDIAMWPGLLLRCRQGTYRPRP